MSTDDKNGGEENHLPSAEVIHLALIRERFEETQRRQGIILEHEEADTVVVYVELSRGFETWTANTLCLDLEKVRRKDKSDGWDELRDPETEYERQAILSALRELHDNMARQWGMLE